MEEINMNRVEKQMAQNVIMIRERANRWSWVKMEIEKNVEGFSSYFVSSSSTSLAGNMTFRLAKNIKRSYGHCLCRGTFTFGRNFAWIRQIKKPKKNLLLCHSDRAAQHNLSWSYASHSKLKHAHIVTDISFH